MNHYEHHARFLNRLAAKGDYEAAFHQALGTIKGLCNDIEDIADRRRRYCTHTIMGVQLSIKYTITPPERGFGESPDCPAQLEDWKIWIVGQDNELTEGELYDAAVEALEAEVADDAVCA